MLMKILLFYFNYFFIYFEEKSASTLCFFLVMCVLRIYIHVYMAEITKTGDRKKIALRSKHLKNLCFLLVSKYATFSNFRKIMNILVKRKTKRMLRNAHFRRKPSTPDQNFTQRTCTFCETFWQRHETPILKLWSGRQLTPKYTSFYFCF